MAVSSNEPTITPDLIARHGLKPEEYQLILEILGRTPSFTELGIFSVMWSEHCSYKNSKPLLKLFPTEGPSVLQGPGENAGVVALDDDLAIAFKMESHNHPSAVEPFQGAATGVGGILRDIFTMGARPVALIDCLFFGEPGTAAVNRIIDGVVNGIAHYGNCVGVPTLAGSLTCAPVYAANPLVNVMAVGVMRKEDLTLAKTETPGNVVVYYGNATGRDGVHGATFASEELTEETQANRSAIQVGDPFMGKKILEATLELIRSGAVEAIQDMGAAGLTCSGCEIAGRGRLGMALDLDLVPQRAEAMSAYEMMLSESQERMLAVVPPDRLAEALSILRKWEVNPAEVGIVTNDGLLTVRYHGQVVAQVPALKISEESPVYEREAKEPVPRFGAVYTPGPWVDELRIKPTLLGLLAHPTTAAKEWVYDQYDTMVQTNTVLGPGAGAAVIRVDGSEKLLAISCGVDPMKVAIDPEVGGMMALGEAVLNLACVGAKPLGLTDNLNFANPEKPEQFWYFRKAVEGLAAAARALVVPVTGGNVSLYNESPLGPIWPTPTVGIVGAIESEQTLIRPGFKKAGEKLWLLGMVPETLAGSKLAWQQEGRLTGPLGISSEDYLSGIVALEALLQQLIAARLLQSAQDVSDGGLLVAVAELLLFGSEGLGVDVYATEEATSFLFGENHCCVVVSVSPELEEEFLDLVDGSDCDYAQIGEVVAGSALRVFWEKDDEVEISREEIAAARNSFRR